MVNADGNGSSSRHDNLLKKRVRYVYRGPFLHKHLPWIGITYILN